MKTACKAIWVSRPYDTITRRAVPTAHLRVVSGTAITRRVWWRGAQAPARVVEQRVNGMGSQALAPKRAWGRGFAIAHHGPAHVASRDPCSTHAGAKGLQGQNGLHAGCEAQRRPGGRAVAPPSSHS